jgi:hypothetical protein
MIRKMLQVSDSSFPQPPSKQKWFKIRILKVPVWLWIFGGFVLIGLMDDATNGSKEQSSDKVEVSPAETSKTTSSSVVIEQRIGVEYQNLTIDCSGSYLMGTVHGSSFRSVSKRPGFSNCENYIGDEYQLSEGSDSWRTAYSIHDSLIGQSSKAKYQRRV